MITLVHVAIIAGMHDLCSRSAIDCTVNPHLQQPAKLERPCMVCEAECGCSTCALTMSVTTAPTG